jgi:hypothetical protein
MNNTKITKPVDNGKPQGSKEMFLEMRENEERKEK